MKKSLKLFSVIAIIALLAYSCDKDETLNVDFNVDYPINLDTEVPANPGKVGSGTFSSIDTVNPANFGQMANYASLIQNVQINNLFATVGNITDTTNVLETVSMSLSNEGFATPVKTAAWNFTNVELKPGKVITFSNSNGQFDAIKSILLNMNKFKVNLNGTANKDNFTFPLELLMKTTVTASPLN